MHALIQNLQSSELETQLNAAAHLASLAERSASKRKLIYEGGAIPRLIQLLSSDEPTLVQCVTAALQSLSGNVTNPDENYIREAIHAFEAIPHLIRLLNTAESEQTKEYAAGTLANLCLNNPTIQNVIRDTGGIHALVALLNSPTASDKAKEHTVGALYNMTIHSDNRTAIYEAGGIPPLIASLRLKSTKLKKMAVIVLGDLAETNPDCKDTIRDEGGIPFLIELLHSTSSGLRTEAARVLESMASQSPTNRDAIRMAGAIPVLARLLSSPLDNDHRIAAGILYRLSYKNNLNQNLIREAGLIPILAALLSSPTASPDTKKAATYALINLTDSHVDNQNVLLLTGAFPTLTELTSEDEIYFEAMIKLSIAIIKSEIALDSDKKSAAAYLSKLITHDPQCKEAMLAEEGCTPALIALLRHSACEATKRFAATTLIHLHSLVVSTETGAPLASLIDFLSMLGARQMTRVPPAAFICPISKDLMEDPVVDSVGKSYDRTSIQAWINTGHLTDPETRMPITTALISNWSLKTQINEWKSAPPPFF